MKFESRKLVSRTIRVSVMVVGVSTLVPIAYPAETGDIAAREYVAETRLSAPKRIETLRLIKSEHDPSRKLSGAVFRYDDESAPNTSITLLVYPAGDLPPTKALNAEFKALQERLERNAKNSDYTDFSIGDASGFSVRLPPRPARSLDVSSAAGDVTTVKLNASSSNKDSTLYPQKPLRGERITIAYVDPKASGSANAPIAKYVYLFNRHMYYVRATVAFSGVRPNRSQEKTANRAIQNIVSQLGIENIGSCGASSTYAPDPSKLTVGQVLRVIDEVDWRGCIGGAAIATIGAADEYNEVITITYDASHWSPP